MKGRYPRALVAAAVTNPFVWLVALLALVLALCASVVAMYVTVWLLVRDELCSARTNVITPPIENDWPLTAPTPGFATCLDEHGRVELVTQEPEPAPASLPPAAPDRKPRARKSVRRKMGDMSATPEHCDDLSHEDLVRRAHRAGFGSANKRWAQAKLVAVLAAPCSPEEAR